MGTQTIMPKATKWTDLVVTDIDGDSSGTLGEMLNDEPEQLETATIINGQIDSWPDYFLSLPDEKPDWDTPHGEVDWTGFMRT